MALIDFIKNFGKKVEGPTSGNSTSEVKKPKSGNQNEGEIARLTDTGTGNNPKTQEDQLVEVADNAGNNNTASVKNETTNNVVKPNAGLKNEGPNTQVTDTDTGESAIERLENDYHKRRDELYDQLKKQSEELKELTSKYDEDKGGWRGLIVKKQREKILVTEASLRVLLEEYFASLNNLTPPEDTNKDDEDNQDKGSAIKLV